jgi:hypothetical protein
MSLDLTINGTAISTLGFMLKEVEGDKSLGQPRKQGAGKEEYTSNNIFLTSYFEESPEPEFELVGVFDSITAAETALYTLYGIMVQVGEHTFIHTDGTSTVSWKGIMKKSSTDYKSYNDGIIFEVKVKTLKTNDV